MTAEQKQSIYADWKIYKEAVLQQFEKESGMSKAERPEGAYLDAFFQYLHFRMCRYLKEEEIAEEQARED